MQKEKDAVVRALTACKKEILLRIGYATVDELAKSIKFQITKLPAELCNKGLIQLHRLQISSAEIL